LCVCALVLSACQGSNEPPLKGKREHIFSDRDQGQVPKKRVIPPVSKTKPSQAGAWPMPFVNTTNHIPALRQTPVSDHWEKGWTFSRGAWNNSYVLMPPIVAWGRVFFVSAGQVFCLEEATGKKVWSYKVVEEKTSVFLGGRVRAVARSSLRDLS
jgi:outer membrane protein assembly factor BamB